MLYYKVILRRKTYSFSKLLHKFIFSPEVYKCFLSLCPYLHFFNLLFACFDSRQFISLLLQFLIKEDLMHFSILGLLMYNNRRNSKFYIHYTCLLCCRRYLQWSLHCFSVSLCQLSLYLNITNPIIDGLDSAWPINPAISQQRYINLLLTKI